MGGWEIVIFSKFKSSFSVQMHFSTTSQSLSNNASSRSGVPKLWVCDLFLGILVFFSVLPCYTSVEIKMDKFPRSSTSALLCFTLYISFEAGYDRGNEMCAFKQTF